MAEYIYDENGELVTDESGGGAFTGPSLPATDRLFSATTTATTAVPTIGVAKQAADEILDYGIQFGAELGDDIADTTTWLVLSGPGAICTDLGHEQYRAVTPTDTIEVVWIQGARRGSTTVVECRMRTGDLRTLDRRIEIRGQ